jgi:hypothetical protein
MRRKKVVYATPTNETREKVLNQIANVKKKKKKPKKKRECPPPPPYGREN